MLRQPQITGAKGRLEGAPRRWSANPEVRLSYSPGLDGLRALAVSAVLLYHADLTLIPGGFLGVEVFFVISGYLISALLLAEWRQKGRIDLKDFWVRRARRLLPALYVLLVVTLTFAVVFLPGEVAGLRGEVVAAVGVCDELVLDLRPGILFRGRGTTVGATALVVVGGGGAVLPDLAGRAGRGAGLGDEASTPAVGAYGGASQARRGRRWR